jgi:hypothetical protein
MSVETKAVVTVAEMSRMIGLSRSRFYQLIGSTFPEPSRDADGRPYYTEEQQIVCLDVRRRNCGINGKPILFYAPRAAIGPSSRPKPRPVTKHAEIIEAVRTLGLTTITAAQVDHAIKVLFPSGTENIAQGEIIRSVFLSIKRQNSTDNVGR